VRAYPTDRAVLVPSDWADAAGCTSRDRHAYLLVVAAGKAAVGILLDSRLRGSSGRLAELCHPRRPGLDDVCQKLVNAGVVRLDRPGVYLWRNAAADFPVVQVNHGGTLETIAYFRYTRAGLTVEKPQQGATA
jgi:hypothetical protein